MANTNDLFLKFEDALKIADAKEKRMMTARDILQDRISTHFKKHHPAYKPKYFIQGSYKMRNTIQTKDNLCDMDLGVHFERIPDVSGATLQLWVFEAINGIGDRREHRKKCIRVHYNDDGNKPDFNIDLPVYAEDQMGLPILAVKDSAFENSDPRGFTEWYRERKTDQSHRKSKYLKAWGDNVRNDMLCGLAMTLLSIRENSEIPDRDDSSLFNILVRIKNTLNAKWEVLMPVRPYDNVVDKHDLEFRRRFFTALDAFIRDAKDALDTDSRSTASKLWRKHLGTRFPLVEDSSSKSSSYLSGVAAGGVKPFTES